MHPDVWRYSLSLITLFALFIAFGDAFDRNRFGSPGFVFQAIGGRQAIVSQLVSGSAADRAGVRNGDRIAAAWVRTTQFGPQTRSGVRAEQRLVFYDARLGRSVSVTTVPIPTTYAPTRVIAHVLRIVTLLFALLLFWRHPQDRAARVLGGFLLLYNLQGFGNSGSFLFGTSFAVFVPAVSTPAMLLMLVLFACWFPERYPNDTRRRIAIGTAIFTGVLILARLSETQYVLYGNGLVLPVSVYAGLTRYGEPVVMALSVAAALFIDFRTAPQIDRMRLEWLTVGMALQAYTILTLSLLTNVFFGLGGAYNDLGLIFTDIAEVTGTFCLLYGFLRYRVLDLTFAINRATVFAAVSTLIVGMFVLVEYLVSKYVESQSHVGGLAITLAAALAVGISLRTIHRHIDRIVDRVVFRQRHEDEETIRAFGRRARFITDEHTLQERTVQTLDQSARSDGSALYLRADGGDYLCAVSSLRGSSDLIDRNDPLPVMMKDAGNACYVEDPSSMVPGELALPMMIRGELFGFAACGKRRIREIYAPDELDAMTQMIDRVGNQLDALRTLRMQSTLGEVTNLLRAHMLLGGDVTTLIDHIAQLTGAAQPLSPSSPAGKTGTT